MNKPRDPLSKSSEKRALQNCRVLLSRISNNTYYHPIWEKNPNGSKIVESINSYQQKEEEIRNGITKLVVTSIVGIGAAITSFTVMPKFIPENVAYIIGLIASIMGVGVLPGTINIAIYNAKVREYLEAAMDYLKRFMPKLLPSVEEKGNAKVKKQNKSST